MKLENCAIIFLSGSVVCFNVPRQPGTSRTANSVFSGGARMFRSRLNELLQTVGASDKAAAEYAGFDRSNISHLRNGQKSPSPESTLTRRLIRGICLYAESNGRLSELCTLTGADPASELSTLMQSVSDWLFAGRENAEAPGLPQVRDKDRAARSFGERFSRAMELAGLTNARLGQLLYVDPSLISRYKRGLRTPDPDSRTAELLSVILFERIQKNGQAEGLADLMDQIAEGIDSADFHDWLFDQKVLPSGNLREVELLLESISSFSEAGQTWASSSDIQLSKAESKGDPSSGSKAVPSFLPTGTAAEAPRSVPSAFSSAPSIYLRTSGIRDAVLRFLGNALTAKAPELLLYSDESQDWMVSDPGFFGTWAALMTSVVQNGTRIRIIHNIDRSLTEMNQAIRGWLPLYLSGMVESFYLGRLKGPRFSHTLFLAPGMEGVAAFHAAGKEADGIYHYYTDPDQVNILEQEYLSLLRTADPLLKAGPVPFYEGKNDLIVLQSTLSVATMPRELAESFGNDTFTARWERAQQNFLDQLRTHSVTECIPVASGEELLAGAVMTGSFEGAGRFQYTAEQYALHLKHIASLEKEHPAYHFRKIPEAPFPEMKLLLASDMAGVISAEHPGFSFSFRHPLLCRAFLHYARELMKKI